jgi:Zn finger protein HypA/HybF involved in hydrogenase expression
MKDKLKGKMVKTDRPKYDTTEISCECLKCGWIGPIEDTKTDNYGTTHCPVCKDEIIVYED